jgi:hypothetical protein
MMRDGLKVLLSANRDISVTAEVGGDLDAVRPAQLSPRPAAIYEDHLSGDISCIGSEKGDHGRDLLRFAGAA